MKRKVPLASGSLENGKEHLKAVLEDGTTHFNNASKGDACTKVSFI
jgi:hypothetical protein